MNIAIISYILGVVCMLEACFMILPLFVSLIYQETAISHTFLLCILICSFLGLALYSLKPKNKHMRPKEGMAIVALCWITMSLLGALPFYISGEIPSYIDAFFETVSGFTTTGSTILTDVGLMSYGNLFWRSFTHWIGGMGVLVFLLALLPSVGATFMNLMMAESPGPDVSKLVPKVRDTAKYLYKIYIVLTGIQFVLLLFAGMEPFDAITITMGTAGTGGFAVRSDGFASYSMLQIDIISIFMLLFGINFNVYFLLLRKKYKQAFTMQEPLTYLGIILGVTAVIVSSVYLLFPTLWDAIQNVFFTVVSIMTTTGFATVDFALWPEICQVLLLILMFIGACAGSTGGGFKVGRMNILFKGIVKEFQTILHPQSIKKVRVDGKPVPHEVVRSVNVFLTVYIAVFIVSLILVSLDNQDFATSFSSVAATMNNIGPGLGKVGPMENFAFYSPFTKLVLSFDMLAGRLELLPLLLVFFPSLWARNNH